MEDLSKLPKWARERIESAERQVRELTEDLTARINNVPTRIAILERINSTVSTVENFLDDHSRIRFHFSDRDHLDVMLLERHERLVLEVSTGFGTVIVAPSSSNVVHVMPDRELSANRYARTSKAATTTDRNQNSSSEGRGQ